MKSRNCIRLALSLGLAFGVMAPALAIADRVETEKANMVRGTNNGQDGYWIEYVTRTYHFTEVAQKAAIRDAFLETLGREPTADELAKYVQQLVNGTSIEDIKKSNSPLPGFTISADELKKIANITPSSMDNLRYPAGIDASAFGDLFTANPPTVFKNIKGQSAADRLAISHSARGTQVTSRSWDTTALFKFAGWMDANGNSIGYPTVSGGLYDQFKSAANLSYQNWGGGKIDYVAPLYLNSPTDNVVHNSVFGDRNVGSGSQYVGYSYGNQKYLDISTSTRDDIAFVMSEGQRYLDMYNALIAVGATQAAAEAQKRAQRAMSLLTTNYSYQVPSGDPLVLDLNYNGKSDVTGLSSAKFRNKNNNKFMAEGSVKFDLLAKGKPVQTEWIKAGDGFLVDDTNRKTTNVIQEGKAISCLNLFGDVEGHANGFFKLAMKDNEARLASSKAMLAKGYGVLQGDELKDLKVWVDNGDGIATLNELKTLEQLGITEIGVMPKVNAKNGELFEESYFVQNGKKHLMQEVWFAYK
ncbi:MAG TPA: hypothetical protein DD435_03165 [Cyanobacteria bacterium UBA8530]|nr:hypothetical protein [Cyanobacteria bacterium UBA8530]